jgi:hypothetical protein
MNESTIIMPCNNSGYMDPKRTIGWSIIDFDWSNGKVRPVIAHLCFDAPPPYSPAFCSGTRSDRAIATGYGVG